ncbi:calcium/sodium antiporter [Hyphomonas sp.]|uniref:calcium/sodium antiporter n=1 Tax=Hyphomonas sp. TaxID=87 RepID=UPI0035646AFB
MTYLMVLGGLVLLFIGGEALVRGSVSVARKLNISELVIGLTLVGFGTSVPELVTSLRAIDQNAVGIAVGNVVGSNIANVLLVLGVAAMIRPILTNPRALARDGLIMLAVTALLCALIWFDLFSRPVGIALLGALFVYLTYSFVADQRRDNEAAVMHVAEGEAVEARYGLFLGLVIAVAGLVGVVFGARLLVDGGVVIARDFGISETIIGLTIVAIGTSLPELVTSVVAAYRGKSDVALGNIIGSNIFNVLGILGVTAVVHPFSVRGDISAEAMSQGHHASIISFEDIGALILSVFLLMLFAITGKQIARWEGVVLLLAYALYFGLLFDLVPVPGILPHA